MKRVASVLAGLWLLSPIGCCCKHLCGTPVCAPACAPMMTPACPPGGPCDVITPGVTPGVAPLVQPQGFYSSYHVPTVAPVAVAPVVTRTALVPLETLPTY